MLDQTINRNENAALVQSTKKHTEQTNVWTNKQTEHIHNQANNQAKQSTLDVSKNKQTEQADKEVTRHMAVQTNKQTERSHLSKHKLIEKTDVKEG